MKQTNPLAVCQSLPYPTRICWERDEIKDMALFHPFLRLAGYVLVCGRQENGHPKDTCALIPKMCEYITLHGRRDFAFTFETLQF